MIDFLRNWVVNIVTLVVFVMLIEMMLPSGKVKKIVNLVTGFILVIGLIILCWSCLKKKLILRSFSWRAAIT